MQLIMNCFHFVGEKSYRRFQLGDLQVLAGNLCFKVVRFGSIGISG
jgi:hypothetical protein